MYFYLWKLAHNFYKIAKSLDEIILEINPSQEIIDFLNSVEADKKQYYVAALRKNPNIKLNELQNIRIKEKNNKDQEHIVKSENFIVKDLPSGLKEWALIQFKKLRSGMEITVEFWKILYYVDEMHIQDLTEIEYLLKINNITKKLVPYISFYKKLNEISDWYDSEKPQIASYSAEQAIKASDEWHKEVAKHGEKLKYQEGLENIVYSFDNGWTIRVISSDNDLNVEGYLMNHCVGSYADEVSSGNVTIYSLRDSANKPHVTLEADGKNPHLSRKLKFDQIQGHSNSDPKPEYKAMIGEWFHSLKLQGKKITMNTSVWEDAQHWTGENINAVQKIISALKNKENEYGAKSNYLNNNSPFLIFASLARYAKDAPRETAKQIIELFHEIDKELYSNLNEIFISTDDFNKVKYLWNKKSSIAFIIDKFNDYQGQFDDSDFHYWFHDWFYQNLNIKYPDSENYPNGTRDQDYLKDIENFNKIWDIEKNKAEKIFKKDVYPFNFELYLKEEIILAQKSDPIPVEPWMGIYNWNNI